LGNERAKPARGGGGWRVLKKESAVPASKASANTCHLELPQDAGGGQKRKQLFEQPVDP
jgi:hypothetical protein